MRNPGFELVHTGLWVGVDKGNSHEKEFRFTYDDHFGRGTADWLSLIRKPRL